MLVGVVVTMLCFCLFSLFSLSLVLGVMFFLMPSLFSLDLECKCIWDAHVFLFVFPLVAVDLFACRALCLTNARAQPSFAHIGSTYTPTNTHTYPPFHLYRHLYIHNHSQMGVIITGSHTPFGLPHRILVFSLLPIFAQYFVSLLTPQGGQTEIR